VEACGAGIIATRLLRETVESTLQKDDIYAMLSSRRTTMSPRAKPVLRGRRWRKGDIQGITPEDLQRMIKVAKNDRYAKRNECLLLVGFSFGLRVSELLNLKIEDIDLDNAQIHLERLKSGKVHDPSMSKALQRTLKAYIKDRAQLRSRYPIRRHGYIVKVAEFGSIKIGELIIKPGERRLNLLRFQFGCPIIGDGTAGSVTTNGTDILPRG